MIKSGTIVGALACQRDSYLKTLKTTVLNCTPIENKVDKKKSKTKGKDKKQETVEPQINKQLYELELEDTILFPEGGGQPADKGFIVIDENDKKIEVIDVQRKNLKAIHITEEPIEKDVKVKIEVDWRRRLDHMQQHTGQHLLSAILDKRGLPTLSWNMGDKINYIEIPRKLTTEEINDISLEVNDEIFNNTKISIEKPVNESTNENIINEEKGLLRIVKIGDLDKNPCCGTHLSSVGQIKAISLLGQIKGKGNNSRLNFITGDRVYQYTSELYEMSKKLMNTLSSNFEELDIKADNLVKQTKKLQHNERNLFKEIAIIKANELLNEINEKINKNSTGITSNNTPDNIQKFYLFREDAGLEFINTVYTSLKEKLSDFDDHVKFSVVLIGGNDGSVIIFSNSDDATNKTVAELKNKVAQLRGGGKGRFQGKISPAEEARKLLLQH